MSARFRDYDSREARRTLCHLYADDGYGDYLGSVWRTADRGWVWEAADYEDYGEDEHGELIAMGTVESRRKAKAALRAFLKEHGVL